MNNKKSFKKIGQYLKYILGLLFLGIVFSFYTSIIWEMFVENYRDVPSIYFIGAVWIGIFALYLKNEEEKLETRLETLWLLCWSAVYIFLVSAFIWVLLNLLILKPVFEIDLTDDRWSDTSLRLLALVWSGGIIVSYLYNNDKKKKQKLETELSNSEEKFEVLAQLPQDKETKLVEKDSTIKAFQFIGTPFQRKITTLSKKNNQPPQNNEK